MNSGLYKFTDEGEGCTSLPELNFSIDDIIAKTFGPTTNEPLTRAFKWRTPSFCCEANWTGILLYCVGPKIMGLFLRKICDHPV